LPTATHDLVEEHDTLERPPYFPGVGLGTTDQAMPFQDSTRVLLELSPTATHDLAERQNTPLKALSFGTMIGLGTTDQAVPFHDSTRVRPRPVLLL
jgi:hypothetical protein